MNRLFTILLIFATGQFTFAQGEYDNEVPDKTEEEFVGFNKKEKEKKDLSRLHLGGGAGFGIGSRQLSFSISPTISYEIIEDRIEIGTGILYNFYRYKEPNLKYIENTVGSNNFVRVFIWEGLFAHFRGVYQKTYIKLNTVSLAPVRQGNVFAGAGYRYQVGGRAAISVGLEINLLPYDVGKERILTPFFQAQFSF